MSVPAWGLRSCCSGSTLRSSGVASARRWFLGFLAFTIALVGCEDGEHAAIGKRTTPAATSATTPLNAPTTTTVPEYISYIAAVKSSVSSVAIYPWPNALEPTQWLPNPWLYEAGNPDSKVPQVFLVENQRPDGWVNVLLPIRPNGTTGWLHASDVDIIPNPFHVVISLSAHTITVTHASSVIYTGPVAVGAPATPTPTGRFYLHVLLRAPDPTAVYGPYAYGLSSHSETLEEFNGGDGEIGIHGNNDASVLGQDVSHGCVRMDNAAITALSELLPLGTPVDIDP